MPVERIKSIEWTPAQRSSIRAIILQERNIMGIEDLRIRHVMKGILDLLMNTPEGQHLMERLTPEKAQRYFAWEYVTKNPLIAELMLQLVPELHDAYEDTIPAKMTSGHVLKRMCLEVLRQHLGGEK